MLCDFIALSFIIYLIYLGHNCLKDFLYPQEVRQLRQKCSKIKIFFIDEGLESFINYDVIDTISLKEINKILDDYNDLMEKYIFAKLIKTYFPKVPMKNIMEQLITFHLDSYQKSCFISIIQQKLELGIICTSTYDFSLLSKIFLELNNR